MVLRLNLFFEYNESIMRKNPKKLKNLIVYILAHYNNTNLTETKLQKLLYFCDFASYERNKKSITGFKYKKNNFGPTISELRKYLDDLEKEGILEIIEGKNYFGNKKRTFSLKTSDVEKIRKGFSDAEVRVIDEVNNAYTALKPKEISDLSHVDFPYLATEHSKEIEYDLVKYRDHDDSDEPEDYSDMVDEEFLNIVSDVSAALDQKKDAS